MRVFITGDCLCITGTLVSSSSGTGICLSSVYVYGGGVRRGAGESSVSWDEFGGIDSTPVFIQDLESHVW